MSLEIGTLEDNWVRLEPLRLEHVEPLLAAATEDRSTFELAPVPDNRADMLAYVHAALRDAEASRSVPFVVLRRADDRVVGATRLMSLEWWTWPAGRIDVAGEPRVLENGDPPDVAEIGHVWLIPAVHRTAVNSAACLLLMRHAFEAWRVHRLVLKTDARNQRSRRAIERVGGHFEGILRAHKPAADGSIRDTAMFSILPADWPKLRERLTAIVEETT